MKPDRVVIGAEDPRAREIMKELYEPFTRTGAPIMMMDCASAELSKYAANGMLATRISFVSESASVELSKYAADAMLATRISFMNEIANVCEVVGAGVDEVPRAVGSDRRIG